MTPKAEVFDKIYHDYLSQIAGLNLSNMARHLNLKQENDALVIPFFEKLYRVSAKGVFDAEEKRPDTMLHHTVCVILCKYLILCPESHPNAGDWVSYKDFKDTAPFVGGFLNTVERPIAEYFSGKSGDLKKACQRIRGYSPPDISLSYELPMQFDALPKIPLLLLFNDRDADFPAQCKVLFRKSAENYLDAECRAMVGMLLASSLKHIVK